MHTISTAMDYSTAMSITLSYTSYILYNCNYTAYMNIIFVSCVYILVYDSNSCVGFFMSFFFSLSLIEDFISFPKWNTYSTISDVSELIKIQLL